MKTIKDTLSTVIGTLLGIWIALIAFNSITYMNYRYQLPMHAVYCDFVELTILSDRQPAINIIKPKMMLTSNWSHHPMVYRAVQKRRDVIQTISGTDTEKLFEAWLRNREPKTAPKKKEKKKKTIKKKKNQSYYTYGNYN